MAIFQMIFRQILLILQKAKDMLVDTRHIVLTEDNFKVEVLQSQMPVLVDCWASWCGSFHRINPAYNEVAIALSGRIKIGRLNIAIAEQLAARYSIRVVPTLLLFQDGCVQERIVGSVTQSALTSIVSSLIPGIASIRSQIACL